MGYSEWIRQHEAMLFAVAAFSVVTFVGSLIAIPWIVVKIPADYFATRKRPDTRWGKRHPAVLIALRILRNAAGIVFIIAGLAMLVLPGQGFLSILIGVMLLNFPGKRALELKIIRQRYVLRSINWMRRKYDREPLRVGRK